MRKSLKVTTLVIINYTRSSANGSAQFHMYYY